MRRAGRTIKDIQCPLPMEGVIDLPYKQIICLPSLPFRNSSFFTLLSETQFFSAYFDLVPNDIVTVWVALDDMRNPAVGPLQYVQKSHLWNDSHSGGTEGFFQKNNHRLDITFTQKIDVYCLNYLLAVLCYTAAAACSREVAKNPTV